MDTIQAEKMFYFKLLVDKYSQGALTVNMGKDRAAVESIRSKYKMQLESKEPFTVNVQLKIKAILNEYSGKRVTPMNIKQIEKNSKRRLNLSA